MKQTLQVWRQQLGTLLVTLQFGLMVWLALLAAPALWAWRLTLPGLALALLALVLAGWTLWHNRIGNFNIHPAPRHDGVLVCSGPYRHIRHPMYTSVLLGGAALACWAVSLAALAVWVSLALVLWFKAGLEEHWLRERYAAYADYCGRSRRFVPWLL